MCWFGPKSFRTAISSAYNAPVPDDRELKVTIVQFWQPSIVHWRAQSKMIKGIGSITGRRKVWRLVCVFVLSSFAFARSDLANAGGGLVGNVLHWAADRTGVKPIGQLGDALDEVHKVIKDAIPPYKYIEEQSSEQVRKRFLDACSAGFHVITDALSAGCANYGGRMDGQDLIAQAKATLIGLGFYKQNDFSGVEIRVCPLRGAASGVTPDRERILLEANTLKDPTFQLVAVLGHEMVHHRQYIDLGSDHFKCDYTREYLSHGTTASNSLEGPAYAVQHQVEAKLDGQLGFGRPTGALVADTTKVGAPIVHLTNGTPHNLKLTLESQRGEATKFSLKKSDWNEYRAYPGDTSFNVFATYIDRGGVKHLVGKNVQAGFSYELVEADGQLDVRSE
jgi:hypothetical protein